MEEKKEKNDFCFGEEFEVRFMDARVHQQEDMI